MATANGEKRLAYEPIPSFDASQIEPDLPEGKWRMTIPHDGIKCRATDKGKPMLIIGHQAKRSYDGGKNSTFEGAVTDVMLTVHNPQKEPKAANMTKRQIQAICEATGVDMGLFPKTMSGSFADFDPFINALKGKEFDAWTVHKIRDQDTGEVQVNVMYTEPKRALGVVGARESHREPTEGSQKKAARRR